MMPIEHFLTDIMQILFADWIEDSVADIGHEIAPTDIFQPTLSNFFKKLSLADYVFYGRASFLVLVLHNKIYNVRRLGFFVRAQPTFCFGRNWHVPIYSARKTLAHLGKKILFTDIDKKKSQSTSPRKHDQSRSINDASLDEADPTFPYRHHANFVLELNWKLNSRHWSWNSGMIFFNWHWAFFLKKLSLADNVFFFTAEEVFLFWCCKKKLQCMSARFFCASSTDVMFRLKLTCSHLFGQENISPSRQKDIIHRYWSKKMTVDVSQERWPIEH